VRGCCRLVGFRTTASPLRVLLQQQHRRAWWRSALGPMPWSLQRHENRGEALRLQVPRNDSSAADLFHRKDPPVFSHGVTIIQPEFTRATDSRSNNYRSNRAGGFRSYRTGLCKHLFAKLAWQVCRCPQIDADAEQFLQLDLQATKVEQGRAGERIHQKIEVASVSIGTMQHRPKNTWVRSTKTARRLAHSGSLEFKGS